MDPRLDRAARAAAPLSCAGAPPAPRTVAEARALQEALAGRVVREDRFGALHTVAGVDVAYGGRRATLARAAAVVLALPSLETLDQAVAERPAPFPYVPGLLSFREAPAALAALAALRCRPDLLLCDGQGIAHPRRFGIASHLGVLLDLPTIGVAKSRLIGEHAPPADVRGACAPLLDRGEVIGVALRTRAGAAPVYVSIGHRVSLETAVRLTLACTLRYRLPEPTRRADHLSKRRG